MANVTKINLDGTAYDIADNTARTTATSAKNTANTANTTAGQAKTAAATAQSTADAAKTAATGAKTAADAAQADANTIAAKAVTVKYNSENTSIVVTTGIPLS